MSLKYVSTSWSFLYQEGLSTHIKHFFEDAVEDKVADNKAIFISDDANM